MKVLLYLEGRKSLSKSGIGRAIEHQAQALAYAGVDFTFAEKDTYDLAHLNSYQPHTYRLMKKLQRQGLKVIVHGHSTHEDFRDSFRLWPLMAPIYDHWMDRMYRRADFIITPTEYSKRLISSYLGVKCPVLALSNGIDLDDYAPNPAYKEAFIKAYQIQPQEKVVMGAGFYFKRKGLDDFFEVARQMPEVRFFWFGHLDKGLTQLKILKAIRHKPANVILPGYVPKEIIKGCLQRADAMLFPSHEENEGIVALEALASHLPLVIRDIGVYQGWLTDGVNCYKATDKAGFLACLRKVFASDNKALVDHGYQVAEERSLKLVGEKLKSAYQQVLETKSR
jgi:1,2-diacylglycerol-3-alpha-glucose alpha-1,2-glucosyltransferase